MLQCTKKRKSEIKVRWRDTADEKTTRNNATLVKISTLVLKTGIGEMKGKDQKEQGLVE